MACAKPFVRRLKIGDTVLKVPVPCGYCAACRRDKISMWTDRLVFESDGKPSTFLTLTYNDEHLPADKSVHLEDWQDFHDTLRHIKGIPKYKYFVTSEYGSVNFRPHMHACIIGLNCLDWTVYSAFEKAWRGRGFFDCSPLNPSRIRYCLKYMHKELKGKMKNDYEKLGLAPLFHTMSKGIGRSWFFKHVDSLRRDGGYYRDGKLRPLPRYYRDLLRVRDDMNIRDWLQFCSKYKARDVAYSPLYSVYGDDFFSDDARLVHLEKEDLLDDLNTIC